jgi:choline-glycine betaine transporter
MKLTRFVITASLPGIVVGLLVTGLTVHAWFSENLHGNFYNRVTGVVDWRYTIMVSVYVFTVVFVATSAIVGVGIAAFSALRSLFVRKRPPR